MPSYKAAPANASPIEAFRDEMASHGLRPPEHIIPDAKIHRFSTNGNHSDLAGWYVLHAGDIPATGIFGDWRSDLKVTWCAKSSQSMTPAERAAYQARVEAMRHEREAAEREIREEAARRAVLILSQAKPAPADYVYILRKRISHTGLVVDQNNRIFVPLQDANGTVVGGQFIHEDGSKRFLTGTPVAGSFYVLGSETANFKTIAIGEGLATMCSVKVATNSTSVVAFCKSNLLAVAKAIRAKYPEADIIITGDNDRDGGGQEKAIEAAKAINAAVAIPEVPGWDWNDALIQQGASAVKDQIEALITPSADAAHLHTPPALAQKDNILAELGSAILACGVVGEVRCAQLVYLMVTSRLLDEPVSAVVKGLSASGKSYTVESTLKFFPDTALIKITAMSEKGLIYMREVFAHRTLVIYEATALREQREKNEGNLTAYLVRSLLSEGRISYPVTVRDKELGFVTKTIVKEGPTNCILTTTATELHGENETRMLSIPTNDTPQQTKAVMRRLAQGKSDAAIDFKPWHDLQEWLATQKNQVTIPYAEYLADHIPPVAVRLRRDFRSILRLIDTHAILHQKTRPRDAQGRIVAIEADYLAVRGLVADLVSAGVGATVPETIRDTVTAIKELDTGGGVSVKAVSERLKIDRSAAQRRLQTARSRGFIHNVEEGRGKPARYALGEPLPEEIELLPKSVSEGVQHTPPTDEAPQHTASGSNYDDYSDGVQVCMPGAGGIEEEVIVDVD
jgi:phage/plasmid primase-like uncharacterized protein